MAEVPDGHPTRPVRALLFFDVRDVVTVLSETSIGAWLDCHSFLSGSGCWGIRRGWGVRSNKWFALHFNVVGVVLIWSDGVTDQIDDSVPDVVMPPDVLALTAGAMKEMHEICCQTDLPIAPAQDTTLRVVADVQGCRRSQKA
jgi:hypothetical protein